MAQDGYAHFNIWACTLENVYKEVMQCADQAADYLSLLVLEPAA